MKDLGNLHLEELLIFLKNREEGISLVVQVGLSY